MDELTRQQQAKVIIIQNILEGNPKANREDLIKLNYDPILVDKALKKLNRKKNLIKEDPVKIFTRKGQAQRFIEQQPIFYDKSGLWWYWKTNSPAYWELTDETDILNQIDDVLGIHAVKSNERNEILNALKMEARKNIPKESKKDWIQFKNGLTSLSSESIELFEPNPCYFITNPIPYDLGDSEETPMMDKIFEQWVGKDHVQTLYEIISYCLIPDYPLHRIFCFIGSGMNGKSCYLNLLRKFVGENNVTSTELDTLMNSRFEITKLHKKLVCQMGETNFSELSRTSLLKKLTGGDLIGFEYKNKNPFEDINYAKILISTNNLPTTSDKTIGFYRRWVIIDFPNQFSEKTDILSTIPDKEYNNLARKCVRLLKNVLKNREFTNEGSIEERIKKYEDKSNPLDKFLKEFTEEDYDSFIFKFDFEKKLNQWCKENRFRQMAENTIGKKMKERGIIEDRRRADWLKDASDKRIRAWNGIKWRGVDR